MRKLLALALLSASVVAATGTAHAQTGSVTTIVGGTVVAGGVLTIAGTGVSATLTGATPGSVLTGLGATAMTVSDLRGNSAGWAVTATYAAPDTGISLGKENVFVTMDPLAAGGVTGPASSAITLAGAGTALTNPVTVATTATGAVADGQPVTNDGAGVTVMTGRVGVQLPVTAKLGEVYGGKVVYTVASVR